MLGKKSKSSIAITTTTTTEKTATKSINKQQEICDDEYEFGIFYCPYKNCEETWDGFHRLYIHLRNIHRAIIPIKQSSSRRPAVYFRTPSGQPLIFNGKLRLNELLLF